MPALLTGMCGQRIEGNEGAATTTAFFIEACPAFESQAIHCLTAWCGEAGLSGKGERDGIDGNQQGELHASPGRCASGMLRGRV